MATLTDDGWACSRCTRALPDPRMAELMHETRERQIAAGTLRGPYKRKNPKKLKLDL